MQQRATWAVEEGRAGRAARATGASGEARLKVAVRAAGEAVAAKSDMGSREC